MLHFLKSMVEKVVGEKFEGVWVMYYPDGMTGLGLHRDDESIFGTSNNMTVASKSITKLAQNFS